MCAVFISGDVVDVQRNRPDGVQLTAVTSLELDERRLRCSSVCNEICHTSVREEENPY